MSTCEKCWTDAHRPGADVVAEYNRLIVERTCTPEEQAGPNAGVCQECLRASLHQWTGECMNRDCKEHGVER